MTEPTLPLAFLAAALAFSFVVASLPERRRRWKTPSAPPIPQAWSLQSLLILVHTVPFDRLSPHQQVEVVRRLREADLGALSMREHGRINLVLGEIALFMGDREEARIRFGAALRWDAGLPIRRMVERLENPHPLSFTSRAA